MGRHRKSVEARLEDGSYRPTVHGPLDSGRLNNLPPMDPDEPPPDQLATEFARQVWREVLPVAARKGILTLGERQLFIVYCEWAGLFEQATREIKRLGAFITKAVKKVKPKGRDQSAAFEDGVEMTLVKNPWLDIRRDAGTDLLKVGSALGLTAVDRCRVVKAKEVGDAPLPATRPVTKLDRVRLATG